ncbi:MAG: protein kinase [Solirubrobacterales bacterium]|nr:protein kinase [Solirubrobacterales bacterium]
MSVSDLSVGSELLGYRVEAVLGRGGMSVVYLAEDLRLRRRVAVKLLAPALAEDEAFRKRFLEESELAASLDHPNVVPIYAAGEADGQLFIAMRYVEGSDLKELLRAGPLSADRAVEVCGQVAEALDFAHERGLVHRDVKPSNVLLDGRGHVYLADFGLTKRLAEPRAVEPGLFGTIDYVAPEQIRGEEVDGWADLYSLGCLLFECLTGEPPFRRATDAAALFAHLQEEPSAPPGLEEVIAKALAKEPEDRYGTCTELVEDTREALRLGEPSRWWQTPVALALAGAALIAIALAVYFAVRGGAGAPSTGASLVRIDLQTNRVADRVQVGPDPSGVAIGGGAVWVTSFKEGSVWRIDRRTHQVVKFSAKGIPTGIAVGEGDAFVANGGDFQTSVTRLDAATGAFLDSSPLDAAVVASGAAGVWAAGEFMVTRLNGGLTAATGGRGPISGGTTQQVTVPFPMDAVHFRESFSGIAVGEGGVWVIGDANDRELIEISPSSPRIVATIALPGVPAGVAAGEGAVWVTDQLDGRVWRIDPARGRIARAIEVGRGPQGVAAGAGGVWVANTIDGTVSRIDPATNRVTATIAVGPGPQSIAVDDRSVWVTTHEGPPR